MNGRTWCLSERWIKSGGDAWRPCIRQKIANFSPSIPTLDLTSATLLPDTMAMKTSGLLANRSRTFFVSAVFNVIKPFIVVLNNLLRQ
jgi:hypothetical protein